MIGRLIDQCVEAVSPSRALRRRAARRVLSLSSEYEAGRPSRFGRDAPTSSSSQDAAYLRRSGAMLARARGAVMNTTQGASIRGSFERNVVRSGITPDFQVADQAGRRDREFNQRAAELWRAWSEDPRAVDLERKLGFGRFQRRAAGELVEAGEHFVVMHYRPRGDTVGLTLQALEPEQLDTSTSTVNVGNGNEIRNGIEVDADGAAVAYHFRRKHPTDGFGFAGIEQPIRVPAERVLHVFDPRRVMQSHGVTRFAPTLNRLGQVGRFEEALTMAALMEACIGLIDKTGPQGSGDFLNAPSGSDGLDTDGNREVEFQPGMVVTGDYDPFVPTRANNQAAEFLMHQARQIGAGAGSSYEQVTRDFSQGTYSSQRQGMLEDWAEYEIIEGVLVETLCRPVLEAFVRTAVAEGRLEAKRFELDPKRYMVADWKGPARPWIDPKKEAEGSEIELELGLNTPQRILNQRGYTIEETYRELAEAQALAAELGLDFGGRRRPLGRDDGDDDDDDGDGGDDGDRAGETLDLHHRNGIEVPRG